MATLVQLKTLKNVQIQDWLRRIGKGHVPALVTALLGADPETLTCVTRNMSMRARSELLADLETARAARIPEAEINRTASELEKLL